MAEGITVRFSENPKEYCRQMYLRDRTKRLADRKEYVKANPKKIRNAQLKRNYGITFEEYEKMLRQQNGVCAICRQPETMVWRGEVRALAVDHNHTTGAVRQLLCKRCNSVLGYMEESPLLLRTAAEYLEKHNG